VLYPFIPVSVTPSINVRWVREKVITTGATIIVLAAIRYGHANASVKVVRRIAITR